jgi:hypothetical protein
LRDTPGLGAVIVTLFQSLNRSDCDGSSPGAVRTTSRLWFTHASAVDCRLSRWHHRAGKHCRSDCRGTTRRLGWSWTIEGSVRGCGRSHVPPASMGGRPMRTPGVAGDPWPSYRRLCTRHDGSGRVTHARTAPRVDLRVDNDGDRAWRCARPCPESDGSDRSRSACDVRRDWDGPDRCRRVGGSVVIAPDMIWAGAASVWQSTTFVEFRRRA